MTDAVRLGSTGQIFVSLAAARTYADAEHLQLEEARRELTEILLDATATPAEPGRPEGWRARSRTTGIDVSARIVREGRLAVVVRVQVRHYHRRS
jgi:hypothetical protein